jgi:hypothetical protein
LPDGWPRTNKHRAFGSSYSESVNRKRTLESTENSAPSDAKSI